MRKLTKETVNKRLAGTPYTLVSAYTRNDTLHEFWCDKGSHVMLQRPAQLFRGRGCPDCSGRKKLTLEQVREVFSASPFTLDEDVHYRLHDVKVKCPEGHAFVTNAKRVIRGDGCPRCCGNVRYTNEEVKEKLASRNLFLVGDYNGINHKCTFRCSQGHIWEAHAGSVLNSGNGCGKCCSKGFRKDKPGILYYLRIEHESLDSPVYKIGITNNSVKERYRLESDVVITPLRELYFKNGEDALNLEQYYLSVFSSFRSSETPFKHGGNTELFSRDIFAVDPR